MKLIQKNKKFISFFILIITSFLIDSIKNNEEEINGDETISNNNNNNENNIKKKNKIQQPQLSQQSQSLNQNDYVFDLADITANYADRYFEYTLEAFRIKENDRILQENESKRYKELKWVSIGYKL